jgi:hypothetical protein
MTPSRRIGGLLACIGLAALSLVVAGEPVYDAWAWLVWGRELAHFGLDVSSGPSWKPLPVVISAVLSPAGDAAAPALWLVLVRAAWLAALLLAAEIAFVLTAGRARALRLAAAAFAATSLALLSDDVTMWARQAAGGMSEPLLVALVLGALRAGLAGRVRGTLMLLALAALVRPEAWPLLVAYGLWCARGDRRARPLVAALVLGVALLWLAPGLLGADGGGAAAGRAQRGTGDPLEALGWAALLPLAVAWPLALVAVRGAGPARLPAGAALGWIALVAVMTLAGFPGLPRFMAPAAAVVGVLGGAGLAALLERPRAHGRVLPALVAVALVAVLVGLPSRVAELPHAWSSSARIDDSHARLRALVREIGRGPLLRCGRLATSDVLVRTALAWELDVPLADVVSFGEPSRRSGAFVVGLQASPGLREAMRAAGTRLGRRGEWSVYSVACPVTASASAAARSAGVSGATR